jgi:MFS family permease
MLQATFALFGEVVLFVGYDERATNLGIGILLSLVGVSQFLTQAILLQRMLKRFGDSMLVIIGGLLRSFAFLAYIIIISPWMAGLGSIFFALGQGLMMPPLQSLATSTVPDEFRGGVLGIYQSSISLSTIISTAIAGMIFAVEPTLPYQLASGLSILVIVPAFFFFRQEKAKKISEAL